MGTFDRHSQWFIIEGCLNRIAERFGSTIFDHRCNKSWDVGQAVCAEAYGSAWMNNKMFREWDQKPDDEPPEPHYLACALKMANGYIPEWTKEDDE